MRIAVRNPLPMLDIQAVRHALLVSEHLSIRRAAAELGLQPSAVSRRLQSLEEGLGVALFDRNSAGAQPTLAGRRFLDRARGALAELEEAACSATSVRMGQVGALGIAFYPSLASGRLLRLLKEHRTRFPELDFSFREGGSADQLTALRHHQVDVAFLIEVGHAPGAASEHLWDEPVYVAAPEHHSIAASATLTWAELRDEVFVVRAYSSGPVIYAWLAGKLDPGGFAPKIHQHDISRECLLGLVSAGYGLTVVAESATALVVPGVVYRPVTDADATMSVRVAWLNENENPALGRFLSHARRVARRARA